MPRLPRCRSTVLPELNQPLANRLPTGSVLVVPGTLRQQKIMEKVRSFFKDHGRSVISVPIEKITRKIKPVSSKYSTLARCYMPLQLIG
jgi:hypothetical protein